MADLDDDPVEHEIDVYLSSSLAENLYLFQYPVRPASLPYDNVPRLAARIKPIQQKVELELGINTQGPNYAKSKGEQIALNVDGSSSSGAGGGEDGAMFESNVMDKQILISDPNVVSMKQYAVGLFKNGELHITPLHGLIQLKPGFTYLDKADSRQKSENDGDLQEEVEEEAKPVTVRFSRPESEEAKARRLASYEYLHKQQQQESWIPCEYHHSQSELSEAEKVNLFSNRSQDFSEFHSSAKDYISMLLPPEANKTEERPALPSNVLSMTQLKTMTISDQIKALLINAKVIKYSQLMALLPRDTDPAIALRSLQQVAMLVQGCWMVKSEILYPKDTCSAHSGIPAEVLCRGRDYVVWRFTQNRFIVRKDISSVIKLPAEDVKDILQQMSKVRVNVGWEFIMEYDKEFIDKHPDVVQRQNMLWDAKYQQLAKVLKITKEMEKKIKAEAIVEKPRRRRNSSRSRTKSESERTRAHSQSEPSDNETNVQMEVDNNQIARVNGESNCVPMEISVETHSTNDNATSLEVKMELRNFIQEKLYSRYVISLSDLKRLFSIKLAQISSSETSITGGISEKLLEETVVEVGGVKLNNQWPVNSKEEPMYALAKTGDKFDVIRGIMLDMFTKQCKIRNAALKQQVELVTGEAPLEADTKRILKDYCVHKGMVWYLKGTLPDT
ncbi:DNA-directed RNA polymerase III subunit RPC5-like [Tubulanus polymorphus]|uniref:DNA-directed RNA polymerase III subunit RPC5-like n=1 Tax=Tubulanus polymorphus TaxID=672921 RepID=UPI003DA32945